jgi:3-carboxy-cis,cis-muconate cycloisomerase
LLAPVWAGGAAGRAVSDAAFVRALLGAEAALARAQARLGLVPAGAAEAITRAAAEGLPDLRDLAVRSRGSGNPVVPLVAWLRSAAGEYGQYVHQGSTSQDILDTATMTVTRDAIRIVVKRLDEGLEGLAALAAGHPGTPMAGRTLGRQAVPTTFGLKVAGWLIGCLEARERLVSLPLPAQFGGAAGTMAGYGDRALALLPVFAEEAGLVEPVLAWHTRRGPVVEAAEALAAVTGALGKAATDVVLLASDEVAEVAEPAAPGRGGSSAMAHKRNPVLATMIRSAALQTPGLVSVLLTAEAGAAHERPAGEWHAEWQPLRECLRLAIGASETASELFAGLEVFPDRMRANLDRLLEILPARDAERGAGHAPELVDRALRHHYWVMSQ